MKTGIIYLVQPTELLGTSRYKIGYSLDNDLNRIKSYKKGTRKILIRECFNPFHFEKIIKNKFKQLFSLIAGTEFFEGNENIMIDEINNIFKKYQFKTEDSLYEINNNLNDFYENEIKLEFNNYLSDISFGGKSLLIKTYIEDNSIKKQLIIFFIDSNFDSKTLNSLSFPFNHFIYKLIKHRIIQNNHIYDLHNLTFYNQIFNFKNIHNNVVLSEPLNDLFNHVFNSQINNTQNKIYNLFYYDTFINQQFNVNILNSNFFHIDTYNYKLKNKFLSHNFDSINYGIFSIVKIKNNFYDTFFLRLYIPYIILYNNTHFYILNREYQFIGLNTQVSYSKNSFLTYQLFKDNSTCWTDDFETNFINLSNIIHKYNSITKNKICLNPNEETTKIFNILK
jgi:hypothetical protein